MDFPSVIVFIAWLLGGFVSGLTGIGGAMLAVPLAAMFIPMHDVILLSCILNLAMDGTLTCIYLRHCRFLRSHLFWLAPFRALSLVSLSCRLCQAGFFRVASGCFSFRMCAGSFCQEERTGKKLLGRREHCRPGGRRAGYGHIL